MAVVVAARDWPSAFGCCNVCVWRVRHVDHVTNAHLAGTATTGRAAVVHRGQQHTRRVCSELLFGGIEAPWRLAMYPKLID